MAKGHRSQIKRERNEVKDTRPSAKLSYARVSVQKACFVLDAIRGKDVQTALGIVTYNPRYASTLIKKLLESAIANAENNNGMNIENLYVEECYANHSDAEIIVNTTPVGMYPKADDCPIDLSRFPSLTGVADVVYNVSCNFGNVYISSCCDFAHNVNDTGCNGCFTSNT